MNPNQTYPDEAKTATACDVFKCCECENFLELKDMRKLTQRDRLTGRKETRLICTECQWDEYASMIECVECGFSVPPENMEEVTQRDVFTGRETKRMLCPECRAQQCRGCDKYFAEDFLSECGKCMCTSACMDCVNDGLCCDDVC